MSWLTADLVCPLDHAQLAPADDSLCCTRCGCRIPVINGIPDFLGISPEAAGSRWRMAQAYEDAFWAGEQKRGRRQTLARAAMALQQRLARCERDGAGGRVLQIGPAAEAEIHDLPAGQRFALEPLALALDRRGQLIHADVHWVCGVGERLPFPDRWFRLVLLINVLDHCADPSRLLAEIHRCLEPRGSLWLTCHTTLPLFKPLLRALTRTRIGYFAGHPWVFTTADLDALCRRASFELLDTSTMTHGFREDGLAFRTAVRSVLLRVRHLLLAPEMMP